MIIRKILKIPADQRYVDSNKILNYFPQSTGSHYWDYMIIESAINRSLSEASSGFAKSSIFNLCRVEENSI